MSIETIALDLEGTLISNAVSQIPRPGLWEFLELCLSVTQRVVMFTTVPEDRFRKIASGLVSEGVAPGWLSTIEYVHWEGKTKNLECIADCDIDSTVLVDDYEIYIEPGQEENWIEIQQFSHPYSENDAELARVGRILKAKAVNGQKGR